jgi:hypothetical protein
MRSALRNLGASLSPSGIVSASKAFLLALSASLSPAGNRSASADLYRIGVYSPTAFVMRSSAVSRSGQEAPSGLLAVGRGYLRSFAGSLSSFGAVSRSVSLLRSAQDSAVVGLTRAVAKSEIAQASFTGGIIFHRLRTIVLSAVLNVIASLGTTTFVGQSRFPTIILWDVTVETEIKWSVVPLTEIEWSVGPQTIILTDIEGVA